MITKPTIHMNGTSAAELAERYEAAAVAVAAALDALTFAAPNARDYYPQGPTAFAEARREHEERILKVRAVRDEIGALYEHALEHLTAQAARRA